MPSGGVERSRAMTSSVGVRIFPAPRKFPVVEAIGNWFAYEVIPSDGSTVIRGKSEE